MDDIENEAATQQENTSQQPVTDTHALDEEVEAPTLSNNEADANVPASEQHDVVASPPPVLRRSTRTHKPPT